MNNNEIKISSIIRIVYLQCPGDRGVVRRVILRESFVDLTRHVEQLFVKKWIVVASR